LIGDQLLAVSLWLSSAQKSLSELTILIKRKINRFDTTELKATSYSQKLKIYGKGNIGTWPEF